MDNIYFLFVNVLFVALLNEPCNGVVDDDPLVVQTSYGPVRGHSFVSSWSKQTVYAFQGIPYAAPPVGNLRFKDPVPPEKWTSVRDCTKDQDSCMQKVDFILQKLNLTFNMSEDCLFINVYTPELKPNKPLPVMVWIHGGGFVEGSGSRFRYGPDFLVAEGVIVVTLNYRIGALGFLTLGTSEMPGNAGMKDQRLALQWVQREIGQFGGDAGKVTIFGESAGSACVHLHYLSPLSKGLFHRVIGESGASLRWAVRTNGSIYGLRLATAINCSTEDLSITQKCLREVPAEAIVNAQEEVKVTDGDFLDDVGLVFVPIVDKTTSNEPFIPDTAKNMFLQKLGSSVPFLMGVNAQEGMMFIHFLGDDYISNITNYMESYVPREIANISTPSRIKLLSQRVKNFYFKEANTFKDKVQGFIKLYSDLMFSYDTAVSAKMFRQRSPVYLYEFEFNGLFKEVPVTWLEEKYNISGVCHAEEMSYLFVRAKVNQTSSADSREMLTWKRMVRMWTNFAKFGTPTVEADPLLQNVTWDPVGKFSTRYLRIDDNLTMESNDFLGPNVALWDTITPNSGYLSLQMAGTVAVATAALYILV